MFYMLGTWGKLPPTELVDWKLAFALKVRTS